jgi:hypothetical protein
LSPLIKIFFLDRPDLKVWALWHLLIKHSLCHSKQSYIQKTGEHPQTHSCVRGQEVPIWQGGTHSGTQTTTTGDFQI